MVFISWVVSILLSCPQAMMFRKLKHPTMEFHQCTTTMVIESYSDIVIENGQAHIRFYGIDPSILYQLYSGSFLFFVYFFPLFCLIISYTIIIIIVKRREKNIEEDEHTHRLVVKALTKKVHSRRFMQTQWKNIKMSLIHVSFFGVFWAPYTIHQAWMIIDKSSANKVPLPVADAMLLTAVFNSCINPLIYGAHYYSDFKTLGRTKENSRRFERINVGDEAPPLSPTSHLSPMSPWGSVERDALLQGGVEEPSQIEQQELKTNKLKNCEIFHGISETPE